MDLRTLEKHEQAYPKMSRQKELTLEHKLMKCKQPPPPKQYEDSTKSFFFEKINMIDKLTF